MQNKELEDIENKKRLLIELKASIDAIDSRFEQIEHEIDELHSRRGENYRKWQALLVDVRAEVFRMHGIDISFRSSDPGGKASDWVKSRGKQCR